MVEMVYPASSFLAKKIAQLLIGRTGSYVSSFTDCVKFQLMSMTWLLCRWVPCLSHLQVFWGLAQCWRTTGHEIMVFRSLECGLPCW